MNHISLVGIKKIFESNLTVETIKEEIEYIDVELSVDDAIVYLKTRGFDVVGIKNRENLQLGFVHINTLEGQKGKVVHYITKFEHQFLITEDTSLLASIRLIKKHNHLFLLNKNQISGIVTRADLQKMPIRLLAFSMMSYLEMIFSAIIKTYIDDNYLAKYINLNRYESAKRIFNERMKRNEAIDLISCIQLADQRDILAKNPRFLEKIGLSKKQFVREMKDMIDIRNEIAHSQKIETINDDSLLNALEFVEQILQKTEDFLREQKLER